MHFLYIIFSKSVNKYYVGETHNVEKRLDLHNSGIFKNAYTKIAKDWRIVLKFECKKRTDAIYLEKFIKRMKSRKFIEKIIQNPNLLSEFLNNSK